jgi:hypothetical protein
MTKGLHVLSTSIEKVFFEKSKVLDQRGNHHKKENIVLIDDDSNIDITLLQERVTEKMNSMIPTTTTNFNNITLLQLKGYTRRETIHLLMKSKVFIDLHVPGKERATHEAVMLNNCLLLGMELNGGDHVDFPSNGPVKRIDGLNMDSIVNGIVNGMLNYNKCIKQWQPLKIKTIEASNNLMIESNRLFQSRHVQFIVAARNSVELNDLWPTIITILITYPLSNIDVYIPNNCSSGWDHMNDYWCLHSHGGLKKYKTY